jgi:ribokinase
MGELRTYLHGYGMIPAFESGPVVETTGPGDAFNGAFSLLITNVEGLRHERGVDKCH